MKRSRNPAWQEAIDIPLRTVSESNAHHHWRARHSRAKVQRYAAYIELRRTYGLCAPRTGPVCIRLTRIAPRVLDDDNLQGALKHVRDGVADWLGIDDGSPQLTWQYSQERGATKVYAVRVEISS